jgi:hypothetical protein
MKPALKSPPKGGFFKAEKYHAGGVFYPIKIGDTLTL